MVNPMVELHCDIRRLPLCIYHKKKLTLRINKSVGMVLGIIKMSNIKTKKIKQI